MYCSKCGKQLADGARFCDGCGTPIGNYARSGAKKGSNIFGAIAALIIAVSVFLPYVSMTLWGTKINVTLFKGGKGDGVIFLILAIIALLFALCRANLGVVLFGIICSGLAIFEGMNLSRSLGSGYTSSFVTRDIGYYLLYFGSFALLVAGIVDNVRKGKEKKFSDQSYNSPGGRWLCKCGTSNSPYDKKCIACGTERPENSYENNLTPTNKYTFGTKEIVISIVVSVVAVVAVIAGIALLGDSKSSNKESAATKYEVTSADKTVISDVRNSILTCLSDEVVYSSIGNKTDFIIHSTGEMECKEEVLLKNVKKIVGDKVKFSPSYKLSGAGDVVFHVEYDSTNWTWKVTQKD